ncbi:MAG: uracil-DNA glycosylase [Phycisphaerales bacterium]
MNKTLEKINKGIKQCTKCRLYKTRTNAVPGEGPENSVIFFLGESPGKTEDISGKPFTGRSGKYLDKLLSEIGISRSEIYITSSVKCRPPQNRKPLPDELEICKANWLVKQISILNPKLIVTLGKTALKQLTGREDNLLQCHGEISTEQGRKYLITFHPASAMRFAKIGNPMKQDFKKLQLFLKKINNLSAKRG